MNSVMCIAARAVGRTTMAAFSALSMLACGQTAPPDDSDDAANYYPLVDGATWTYRHSSNGGWDETITVEEDELDGETVYIFEDTPNPDNERSVATIAETDDGIMRIARKVYSTENSRDELLFSVEYDPGFLRFDPAWLDKEEGFKETRDYVRLETDAGQEPDDPGDREHFYTVESLSETVVTDAGTFRNCIRIRRRRNWQLADTTAADAQEKLFYFAPGVGKVKEENLTKGNTEVLLDYDIPSAD